MDNQNDGKKMHINLIINIKNLNVVPYKQNNEYKYSSNTHRIITVIKTLTETFLHIISLITAQTVLASMSLNSKTLHHNTSTLHCTRIYEFETVKLRIVIFSSLHCTRIDELEPVSQSLGHNLR